MESEALASKVKARQAAAEHGLGCQTEKPGREGRGLASGDQAWA